MRRTRENVKFVADLKLKLLVFSDVSIVNSERLLGLRSGRNQESYAEENDQECADLPLPLGEGWGEGAKLSG